LEWLAQRKIHNMQDVVSKQEESILQQRLKVQEAQHTIDQQKKDMADVEELIGRQRVELATNEEILRTSQATALINQSKIEASSSAIQQLQQLSAERKAVELVRRNLIKTLEEDIRVHEREAGDQMGPLPEVPSQRTSHNRSNSKRHKRSGPNPRGMFDGYWTIIDSKRSARWLHSIHITGEIALLGEGQKKYLHQMPDGSPALEGGALYFEGDVLCRAAAKSGHIYKYTRLQSLERDEDGGIKKYLPGEIVELADVDLARGSWRTQYTEQSEDSANSNCSLSSRRSLESNDPLQNETAFRESQSTSGSSAVSSPLSQRYIADCQDSPLSNVERPSNRSFPSQVQPQCMGREESRDN